MLAMVLQSLLGLAAVLGLFALIIWGSRRFQQQYGHASDRDFRVIKRLPLDNKNSLVEVRYQGRHYLLGISPGGMMQLNHEQALHDQAATVVNDDDL